MEQPTPEIEKQICAYIRQGSFPDAAAEASGLPRDVFRHWLAQGDVPQADPSLRSFAAAVRQATAQARVLAEMETAKKNPLAWLKHGPGRDRLDMPGWALPVRAQVARDGRTDEPLAQGEVAQLCADLLRVLVSFPDARAAVAEALKEVLPPEGQQPQTSHQGGTP